MRSSRKVTIAFFYLFLQAPSLNWHQQKKTSVCCSFPTDLVWKKKKKCTGGIFNVKNSIAICFSTVSSLDAFHAEIVKTQLRESSQELCRWRLWGREGCKELLHPVWLEATGCFHSKLHFQAGWAEHLVTKYWRTECRKFSCFCIGEWSNFIT